MLSTLRTRAVAALGSDARAVREVFQSIEYRDLRPMDALLRGRPEMPWSRTWREETTDTLVLRTSAARRSPDSRTPLMVALLTTPQYQLSLLARQPSVLSGLAKGAPYTLSGLTAAKALCASSANPSAAWGAVAREAAAAWRDEAARILLDEGGGRLATVVDAAGRGALHYAAAAGDAATVERLRGLGADAESTDHFGRSPAHFAASRNYAEVALALTSQGRGGREDAFGQTVDSMLARHLALRASGEVLRVAGGKRLLPLDLLRDYVALGLPVLVENGAAHLPAMALWADSARLAERLGDARLSTGPVPYPKSMGYAGRDVTWLEFLALSLKNPPEPTGSAAPSRAPAVAPGAAPAAAPEEKQAAAPTDAAAGVPDYLFDATFTKKAPELLGDVELLPPALCEEGHVAYVRHPQIGAGPPGAGVPMHAHFGALNALFSGAKKWFLLPPEHTFYGHAPVLRWSESSDCAAFRAEGSLVEVTQRAGDLLFIPEGWGHATLLEEPGVGIGLEFIASSSIFS